MARAESSQRIRDAKVTKRSGPVLRTGRERPSALLHIRELRFCSLGLSVVLFFAALLVFFKAPPSVDAVSCRPESASDSDYSAYKDMAAQIQFVEDQVQNNGGPSSGTGPYTDDNERSQGSSEQAGSSNTSAAAGILSAAGGAVAAVAGKKKRKRKGSHPESDTCDNLSEEGNNATTTKSGRSALVKDWIPKDVDPSTLLQHGGVDVYSKKGEKATIIPPRNDITVAELEDLGMETDLAVQVEAFWCRNVKPTDEDLAKLAGPDDSILPASAGVKHGLFRCEKDGHVAAAPITSRFYVGTGCTKCLAAERKKARIAQTGDRVPGDVDPRTLLENEGDDVYSRTGAKSTLLRPGPNLNAAALQEMGLDADIAKQISDFYITGTQPLDPSLSGLLAPEEKFSPGTKKKALFRCMNKHVSLSVIYERAVEGTYCKICHDEEQSYSAQRSGSAKKKRAKKTPVIPVGIDPDTLFREDGKGGNIVVANDGSTSSLLRPSSDLTAEELEEGGLDPAIAKQIVAFYRNKTVPDDADLTELLQTGKPITSGSKKIVLFRCAAAGHVTLDPLIARVRGQKRCGVCVSDKRTKIVERRGQSQATESKIPEGVEPSTLLVNGGDDVYSNKGAKSSLLRPTVETTAAELEALGLDAVRANQIASFYRDGTLPTDPTLVGLIGPGDSFTTGGDRVGLFQCSNKHVNVAAIRLKAIVGINCQSCRTIELIKNAERQGDRHKLRKAPKLPRDVPSDSPSLLENGGDHVYSTDGIRSTILRPSKDITLDMLLKGGMDKAIATQVVELYTNGTTPEDQDVRMLITADDKVAKGSSLKALFRCEKEHIVISFIGNRARLGDGCSLCQKDERAKKASRKAVAPKQSTPKIPDRTNPSTLLKNGGDDVYSSKGLKSTLIRPRADITAEELVRLGLEAPLASEVEAFWRNGVIPTLSALLELVAVGEKITEGSGRSGLFRCDNGHCSITAISNRATLGRGCGSCDTDAKAYNAARRGNKERAMRKVPEDVDAETLLENGGDDVYSSQGDRSILLRPDEVSSVDQLVEHGLDQELAEIVAAFYRNEVEHLEGDLKGLLGPGEKIIWTSTDRKAIFKCAARGHCTVSLVSNRARNGDRCWKCQDEKLKAALSSGKRRRRQTATGLIPSNVDPQTLLENGGDDVYAWNGTKSTLLRPDKQTAPTQLVKLGLDQDRSEQVAAFYHSDTIPSDASLKNLLGPGEDPIKCSSRRALFRCEPGGHVTITTIQSRTSGVGCALCPMSIFNKFVSSMVDAPALRTAIATDHSLRSALQVMFFQKRGNFNITRKGRAAMDENDKQQREAGDGAAGDPIPLSLEGALAIVEDVATVMDRSLANQSEMPSVGDDSEDDGADGVSASDPLDAGVGPSAPTATDQDNAPVPENPENPANPADLSIRTARRRRLSSKLGSSAPHCQFLEFCVRRLMFHVLQTEVFTTTKEDSVIHVQNDEQKVRLEALRHAIIGDLSKLCGPGGTDQLFSRFYLVVFATFVTRILVAHNRATNLSLPGQSLFLNQVFGDAHLNLPSALWDMMRDLGTFQTKLDGMDGTPVAIEGLLADLLRADQTIPLGFIEMSEPGSGKTLSAIIALSSMTGNETAIVLSPKSLTAQWVKELRAILPSSPTNVLPAFNVIDLHCQDWSNIDNIARILDTSGDRLFVRGTPTVIVMSYSMLTGPHVAKKRDEDRAAHDERVRASRRQRLRELFNYLTADDRMRKIAWLVVDEMHMVKIRDHERSESQSSTNAVPDVVNDQEVNIESGDQDANLRRTIRRQQVEDLQTMAMERNRDLRVFALTGTPFVTSYQDTTSLLRLASHRHNSKSAELRNTRPRDFSEIHPRDPISLLLLNQLLTNNGIRVTFRPMANRMHAVVVQPTSEQQKLLDQHQTRDFKRRTLMAQISVPQAGTLFEYKGEFGDVFGKREDKPPVSLRDLLLPYESLGDSSDTDQIRIVRPLIVYSHWTGIGSLSKKEKKGMVSRTDDNDLKQSILRTIIEQFSDLEGSMVRVKIGDQAVAGIEPVPFHYCVWVGNLKSCTLAGIIDKTRSSEANLEALKDAWAAGRIQLLIISDVLATGVDRLQDANPNIAVATLPDTISDLEQLFARAIRRPTARFKHGWEPVDVYILLLQENSRVKKTSGKSKGKGKPGVSETRRTFGWDIDRINVLASKRGQKDAVVSGLLPYRQSEFDATLEEAIVQLASRDDFVVLDPIGNIPREETPATEQPFLSKRQLVADSNHEPDPIAPKRPRLLEMSDNDDEEEAPSQVIRKAQESDRRRQEREENEIWTNFVTKHLAHEKSGLLEHLWQTSKVEIIDQNYVEYLAFKTEFDFEKSSERHLVGRTDITSTLTAASKDDYLRGRFLGVLCQTSDRPVEDKTKNIWQWICQMERDSIALPKRYESPNIWIQAVNVNGRLWGLVFLGLLHEAALLRERTLL